MFTGSPHYLLTKNGKTHGTNVLENNLEEEEYEAFSDYYLICSHHIKNLLDENGHKDVKIYLSPVNEPQWDWGGEGAIQQGCHFGYEELAKFYDVFHKRMKTFNAEHRTNFVMDIFESGSYNLNKKKAHLKKYLQEFAKYDYFDELEELSVHSYGAEDSNIIRNRFQKYLKRHNMDKKITMSEYCVMQWGVDTSVDMGIYSSKVLLKDLAFNNATEWSWWLGLAFGGYEDGLVTARKTCRGRANVFKHTQISFKKHNNIRLFKINTKNIANLGNILYLIMSESMVKFPSMTSICKLCCLLVLSAKTNKSCFSLVAVKSFVSVFPSKVIFILHA